MTSGTRAAARRLSGAAKPAGDLEEMYQKAVVSIAHNDDPAELRVAFVQQTLTVGLVAELFGRTPRQVALAVLRVRAAGAEP